MIVRARRGHSHHAARGARSDIARVNRVVVQDDSCVSALPFLNATVLPAAEAGFGVNDWAPFRPVTRMVTAALPPPDGVVLLSPPPPQLDTAAAVAAIANAVQSQTRICIASFPWKPLGPGSSSRLSAMLHRPISADT